MLCRDAGLLRYPLAFKVMAGRAVEKSDTADGDNVVVIDGKRKTIASRHVSARGNPQKTR